MHRTWNTLIFEGAIVDAERIIDYYITGEITSETKS